MSMPSRYWSERIRRNFPSRSNRRSPPRRRSLSVFLLNYWSDVPTSPAPERLMAAQNAQIGIAYAAYYPDLTLQRQRRI